MQRSSERKKVCCLYCHREFLVSSRAFSVCCPGCSQRLDVEDRDFIGYFHTPHGIETSGDCRIAATGELRARLHVHSLECAGRLQGDVMAYEKVTFGDQARAIGDVTAPRLEVQAGARLQGYFQIGPA